MEREAHPMKLGILGASRVVDLAILPHAEGLFDVVALAARDRDRARGFARLRGIPRAYGGYEALLADPQIEVVYNALPCSEHMNWTVRALEAGKHVLCEKPFALDADSAEEAVDLAERKGLLLMEAHHWRYHCLVPVFEREAQALSGLKRVEAKFVVGLNHEGDIRKNPALGAGVTMDFGCYLVQWARFAAHAWGYFTSPRVRSAVLLEETADIDVVSDVVLDMGGIEAHLHCDMRDNTPFEAYFRGIFSDGCLEFYNPLGVEGSRVTLCRGGQDRTWADVPQSTYRRQLEEFSRALCRGTSVPTSGSATLETQRVLDEIYRVAGLSSRKELSCSSRTLGRMKTP